MNEPCKLLIIDDSEEILNALCTYFKQKNHTVFSAANGLDGLKLLDTEAGTFMITRKEDGELEVEIALHPDAQLRAATPNTEVRHRKPGAPTARVEREVEPVEPVTRVVAVGIQRFRAQHLDTGVEERDPLP